MIKIAALIAVLTLVAAGCGGDDDEDITVGFQYSLTNVSFFQTMAVGARQAAADAGVQYEAVGPPDIQPDVAIQQFNDLRSRTDYVVSHAAPPDIWIVPHEEAVGAGAQLVTVADAPAPGSVAPVYIGDNGLRSGRVLVEEVIPFLPRTDGKVVIGNCVPGFPTQDDRVTGMVAAVEELLPDAEIITADNGIDPAQNFASWENLIATHGDEAIAFLGNCDTSGPNLVQLKQQDPGDWVIATFDIPQGTLLGVQDGTMAVALGGSPYVIGYVAVRLLAESAKTGDDFPSGWYDMGAEVVTADNVDEILAREASDQGLIDYYDTLLNGIFDDYPDVPSDGSIADALTDQPATTNNDNPWIAYDSDPSSNP
jgi:ribose transport system substrate-binding protein